MSSQELCGYHQGQDLTSIASFFDQLAACADRDGVSLRQLEAFFDELNTLSRNASRRISRPAKREPTTEAMAEFLSELKPYEKLAKRASKTFDPWAVTGIGRNEVRNCRVLAWALDPHGSHGYGADITNAILQILRRDWLSARTRDFDPSEFPLPERLSDYRVTLELSPFADRSKRVDIVFDGPDFCVFFEVKIDAAEGHEQTRSYLELVERRARTMGKDHWAILFIAPRTFSRISADGPRVLQLNWSDVAQAIDAVVGSDGSRSYAGSALMQFAAHIRTF